MLCNKIRSGVICLILTVTAFFMAGFTGSAKAKGEHMKKALIVYGSFMGSTIEVANAVKEELEKAGFAVDARAAGENVPDMSGYSLVVLGSAIHGAAPHPDITAFVAENCGKLKQARTAVFIVCATITSANAKIRAKAEKYPEKVAVCFTPASTAVFGGVLGAPKGGFERFMAGLFLGLKEFGDFRDWVKIRQWAKSLACSAG